MEDIQLQLDEKKHGLFFIAEKGEQIAKMLIGISGNDLTVYHTEVSADHAGKGLAKELLLSMANYARKNNLKVIAFCPYVLSQFKRHPEEYQDIWKNKTTADIREQ